MQFRIMSLTPIQQQIVKLKSDGKSNDEISKLLGLPVDEVEAAERWISRKLSQRWRKTASECWKIIKHWNVTSTLVVFICLAPMIEDMSMIRGRAPTRVKTQYSRVTKLSRKR